MPSLVTKNVNNDDNDGDGAVVALKVEEENKSGEENIVANNDNDQVELITEGGNNSNINNNNNNNDDDTANSVPQEEEHTQHHNHTREENIIPKNNNRMKIMENYFEEEEHEDEDDGDDEAEEEKATCKIMSANEEGGMIVDNDTHEENSPLVGQTDVDVATQNVKSESNDTTEKKGNTTSEMIISVDTKQTLNNSDAASSTSRMNKPNELESDSRVLEGKKKSNSESNNTDQKGIETSELKKIVGTKQTLNENATSKINKPNELEESARDLKGTEEKKSNSESNKTEQNGNNETSEEESSKVLLSAVDPKHIMSKPAASDNNKLKEGPSENEKESETDAEKKNKGGETMDTATKKTDEVIPGTLNEGAKENNNKLKDSTDKADTRSNGSEKEWSSSERSAGCDDANDGESNDEPPKKKRKEELSLSASTGTMSTRSSTDKVRPATATGCPHNKTTAQRMEKEGRVVKLSLLLPASGSGKLGIILRDDVQHFGHPYITAIKLNSPVRGMIPLDVLGKFLVIGIESISEGRKYYDIRNGEDFGRKINGLRREGKESMVEITLVRPGDLKKGLRLLPSPAGVSHPTAAAIPQVQIQKQVQKKVKQQVQVQMQQQLQKLVQQQVQQQVQHPHQAQTRQAQIQQQQIKTQQMMTMMNTTMQHDTQQQRLPWPKAAAQSNCNGEQLKAAERQLETDTRHPPTVQPPTLEQGQQNPPTRQLRDLDKSQESAQSELEMVMLQAQQQNLAAAQSKCNREQLKVAERQIERQLPLPSQVPRWHLETEGKKNKRSPRPERRTRATTDEKIRRALSEFFVEGEKRTLKHFCQGYSRLFSVISREVDECPHLRMLLARRAEGEVFTEENARLAIDLINDIYSYDPRVQTNKRKRGQEQQPQQEQEQNQIVGSNGKAQFPPLTCKGLCQGVQLKCVEDYHAEEDRDKDYLTKKANLNFFRGWRDKDCLFTAELDSHK